MKITGAEYHRREFQYVFSGQRVPPRKPDFDWLIGKEMLALEAGRHRRRVVSHDQIPRSQQSPKIRSSVVSDATQSINSQQLCIRRTLNRSGSGYHCYAPSVPTALASLFVPNKSSKFDISERLRRLPCGESLTHREARSDPLSGG